MRLVAHHLVMAPHGMRLDLSLAAGECAALLDLGASGTDLSTLADLLAGHLWVHGAAITVDGRPVAGTPAGSRGIGLVSARDPLFPQLSVRDNVMFPLRAAGMNPTEATARAAETLALLGLDAVASRRPATLEPEHILRAAIARAIATTPDVLVLDDPFATLDQRARSALRRAIARLQRARGLTVLLLTRDREEALLMAGRIGVIEGGKLLQMAPAATLFGRPACARVAEGFGGANSLPGLVMAVEDDVATLRLACGSEMEAMAEPGIEVGEMAVLTVRPGQIAPLFPPPGRRGATTETENDGNIPATLVALAHLGDYLRLGFRLACGTEVIVHRPPLSGLAERQPGVPALLAWTPGSALAFPSSAEQD